MCSEFKIGNENSVAYLLSLLIFDMGFKKLIYDGQLISRIQLRVPYTRHYIPLLNKNRVFLGSEKFLVLQTALQYKLKNFVPTFFFVPNLGILALSLGSTKLNEYS